MSRSVHASSHRSHHAPALRTWHSVTASSTSKSAFCTRSPSLPSQPPLRDPFEQRDVELHLVDAEAQHVEVVAFGLSRHLVLPRRARAPAGRAARGATSCACVPVSTSNASTQPAETLGSSKANAASTSTMNTSCTLLTCASSCEHRVGVVEQEIRDHRHHRGLAREADRASRSGCRRSSGPAARARSGRPRGSESPGPCRCAAARAELVGSLASKVMQADRVLEEHRRHADGGDRARDRSIARNRHAVRCRSASTRERSATMITPEVRRLLELADDQRAEVGQRRLRPVDVSKRSPACQSRRPTKSKPGAVEHAGSARRS